MGYKVMINLLTTDFEDTICLEYDGIIYETMEAAQRAAYQANIHECDNEYLECILIEEI